MTKHQKRLALLALIAVELVGAALVLRWVVASGKEEHVVGIWMADGMPAAVTQVVQGWVSTDSREMAWTDLERARVHVDWQKRPGADPLAEIVLVAADRFPSLRNGVRRDELRQVWLGSPSSSDTVSRLYVSAETAATLDVLFGLHRSDRVAVVPAGELAGRVWAEPGSLAIVPFDRLEPSLRSLPVDDLDALDRDLDLRRYPLVASIWGDGPRDQVATLSTALRGQGVDTNRHLDRLTVLDMTGVTALTRHVGLEMEARGDPGWPGRRLANLLSSADLTHVSNEVSFMPGCPLQAEMPAFCSPPEYLETLRLIGADVIELTGNHNLDFGPEYALYSLDLYAEAGMVLYGGGRNEADARQPLVVTHNGNRLAFLGYNAFGPDYAWATDDSPGAARFSAAVLQADLAGARPQADLIFVTLQYTETYGTSPLAQQVTDFRAAIDAGADIVSGSQAHQPQAMEFYQGKPILYGLGNLFFDQTWSDDTCENLIARYFIYRGQLLAVQLIPTVVADDLQPGVADRERRQEILQTVFDASGW